MRTDTCNRWLQDPFLAVRVFCGGSVTGALERRAFGKALAIHSKTTSDM